MKTVTTTEAKARLNALLTEVEAGETITITNHGRSIAVLSKADPHRRRFGQFAGLVTLTDDFDAPLGEEELAAWEAR